MYGHTVLGCSPGLPNNSKAEYHVRVKSSA